MAPRKKTANLLTYFENEERLGRMPTTVRCPSDPETHIEWALRTLRTDWTDLRQLLS